MMWRSHARRQMPRRHDLQPADRAREPTRRSLPFSPQRREGRGRAPSTD